MCCAQFTQSIAGAMGISLNVKGDVKQDSEDGRRGKKDGDKPTWGNYTAEEPFR
jgi:hypothetical protein